MREIASTSFKMLWGRTHRYPAKICPPHSQNVMPIYLSSFPYLSPCNSDREDRVNPDSQWHNVVTTGPGAGYYDGPSQWRKAVVPKHFTVPYPMFVTAATPLPLRRYSAYNTCQG